MPRHLFAAAVVLMMLAACTGVPEGVRPVGDFDAGRYLGTWHEIARLDHSFERGLGSVTATYARRADGGIDVVNRGFDAARNEWREARGRAYFLGDERTASLKVSFFGPFYGGYHVVDLDREGYRWAMVAGPSRDYLWILAREPSLPREILDPLLARARGLGFDTGALIFPAHSAR